MRKLDVARALTRPWMGGTILRIRRLIPMLVVSLLVAVPVGAAQAATQIETHEYDGAFAFFDTWDEAHCIETRGIISVYNQVDRVGRGAPTFVSTGYVDVDGYNWCTNEYILVASVNPILPRDALQIANDLSAASLDATVEVCDFVSGTCFPLDISVVWTETGERTRWRNRTQWSQDGTTYVQTQSGQDQGATASGTMSDGTTNFAQGTVQAGLFSSLTRTVATSP